MNPNFRTESGLGVKDNTLLTEVYLFWNPLHDNTYYMNAPKLDGGQVSVSISDLSGRHIYTNMLVF